MTERTTERPTERAAGAVHRAACLTEDARDDCIIMARAARSSVLESLRGSHYCGANRWIASIHWRSGRDRAVFSTGFSTESVNIVQHLGGRDLKDKVPLHEAAPRVRAREIECRL